MNTLKDALQAAQIRELLRAARNARKAEGRTGRRVCDEYRCFMRHYQEFAEEERIDGFSASRTGSISPSVRADRREQVRIAQAMADVEGGAYNVLFVMPKLRELLTPRMPSDSSSAPTDRQRQESAPPALVAEKGRSLNDRCHHKRRRSLDEFMRASALRGGTNGFGRLDR